jgi:hypothetical protein
MGFLEELRGLGGFVEGNINVLISVPLFGGFSIG